MSPGIFIGAALFALRALELNVLGQLAMIDFLLQGAGQFSSCDVEHKGNAPSA